MLEIIPMKYEISDTKYDSTNFKNIYSIQYNKENDKFVNANTNEKVEFDLEKFVDYYTDFHIEEAKLMKGNLKYYSNRDVMRGMCKHILSDIIPGYHYETHFVLDDTEIIGFIRIRLFKNKIENMVSISELYTVPQYRNRGIATSLLNFAKKIAIKNGVPCIKLAVQKGNFDAIKLYKEFGFKVTEDSHYKPIIGSQEQLFLYQLWQ